MCPGRAVSYTSQEIANPLGIKEEKGERRLSSVTTEYALADRSRRPERSAVGNLAPPARMGLNSMILAPPARMGLNKMFGIGEQAVGGELIGIGC